MFQKQTDDQKWKDWLVGTESNLQKKLVFMVKEPERESTASLLPDRENFLPRTYYS